MEDSTNTNAFKAFPSLADQIEQAARLIATPGAVIELRATKVPDRPKDPAVWRKTWAGFYDAEHLGQLARDAVMLDRKGAAAVYVTLNPVSLDLLAYRCNRVDTDKSQSLTKASDILRRRWLLVDVDPERRKGISSSELEHELAIHEARALRGALHERGWPSPIMADSGNGCHLLYRIDEPNDDTTRLLIRGVLKGLASMLDVQGVGVDEKVFDANRICKLPGTMARKGDMTEARPHRRSRLLDVPTELEPVGRALLEQMAEGHLEPIDDGPKSRSSRPSRQSSKTRRDWPEPTEAEIEDALGAVDPDSYDTWLRVGMALHSWDASRGRAIWDKWSATSGKYEAKEQHKTWISFTGSGRTIATVFGMARENGWEPAHKRKLDTRAAKRREERKEGAQGSTPPKPDGPPEVKVVVVDGRRVVELDNRVAPHVDQLEQAIDETGAVFVRGGQLVQVVSQGPTKRRSKLQRAEGSPLIAPIQPARLRELAAELFDYRVKDARSNRWQPRLPPADIIHGLMARGQWGLPQICSVASAPQLRPDGSLAREPGLDEATGVYLRYDPKDWPEIPERPTPSEIDNAKASLAYPLQDFPFKSTHDLSAALAAILTGCARGAIVGPTPMFTIRAPVAGSGKSLLASLVSIIATGRAPALMTPSKTDEEDRKRLLALALAGDPVVVLDNIEKPLGSAALAAAITAGEIRDRVLNETRMATAEFRPLLIATGNNLVVRGDLGRRVNPVDLDPRCESPEERSGFAVPNVKTWVTANRRALYSAALMILRGYFAAGSPRAKLPPMGSFEAWSRLVRQALVWAGFDDPALGRIAMRSEGDTGRLSLLATLAAWFDAYGSRPRTAAAVIDDIEHDRPSEDRARDLRDALEDLLGAKPGTLSSRRLGTCLRGHAERMVDGYRFVADGHDRLKRRMWKVERSEPSE
jgi:hypothetical protein